MIFGFTDKFQYWKKKKKKADLGYSKFENGQSHFYSK